jgi:ATP-dependent Lon protease
LQALIENRKRSAPYAGAFLVKDEEGTDPSIVASPDSSDNKTIDSLKGKELLKRLHEVGTLAQVIDD